MNETVTIRKFEKKDVLNKVRWINDADINQYLHYHLPLEVDKTNLWYENIKDKTDRYDAVIEYDNQPVGVIGLLNINNEQAEYYIALGEKAYQGKGISKKATKLLLQYAFLELNLAMVYLYTEVDNVAAQKLFERSGFYKLRVEKNSAVNKGTLVDRYYYQISKTDFLKQEEDVL